MLLVLIAAVLCWALDGVLTGAPITKDARQNLQAAYNLYAWGVFSTKPPMPGPPSPDNYREPALPFVTSLFMRACAGPGAAPAFDDFVRGGLCRPVKRVNIFWAFALLLGCAVLAAGLTRSTPVAALCVLLIYAVFLRNPEHIDTLCTEVPTAAVMVWTSILLSACMRSAGLLSALCAGLLLGLLCLTKAVFLYLAVPIALAVFVCIASGSQVKKMRALSCTALLMAGISLAAGPWMLRNHSRLGSLTLTLRGGAVLYGRTLRDTMTMDEVIGAFYLWGPGAYKKLVRNTFFDMRPEDYEEGGKAARINRSADSNFARRDALAVQAGKPEDAISFHSRGRAQRVKLTRQYRSLGDSHAQLAADRRLQREACLWIAQHPFRHSLMTIPFAWRGAWCFYGGGVFTALNALCCMAFVVLAGCAVCAGGSRLRAFVLLPLLLLFFNAFLTHNLSRYSAPAIPYLVISLFALFPLRRGRDGVQ